MNLSTAFSSMANHSIFTTQDNLTYSWGENYMGSLGLGPAVDSPHIPVTGSSPQLISFPLPSDTTLSSLACGTHHTLALTSDSLLLGWGRNDDYQLGALDYEARHSPEFIKLPTEEKITGIGAGSFHSMAITEGGSLWIWGDNSFGQLGQGEELRGRTREAQPKKVNIPEPVAYASGGRNHTLVLTKSGNLYVFGSNYNDQLGLPSDQLSPENTLLPPSSLPTKETKVHVPLLHPLRDVLKVACSCFASVVLTKDGQVHHWGSIEDYGRALPPPPIHDPVILAVGTTHAVALLQDGSLVGWGEFGFGQLGGRSEEGKEARWRIKERVGGIVCGRNTTYVVTEEGNLYSWGEEWKLGLAFKKGEEGGKEEEGESYPFKVALPQDNKRKTSWDKIFIWLFLGHVDSSSKFSVFPIEAIFHTVNVYWK
jgi:alpha-tubulin suppressor-like RCC1 family protein